ncbi:MAG: MlaD family protein [bacterium]
MDSQIKKTLVGIYILGGVILFVIFYILLSGRISLHPTREIKVYFDDVTGLRTGDPVIIYGLEKGRVKSLQLENNRVLVILAIDQGMQLFDDSKITIRLVNYLGSDRYIKILPGTSGVIPEYYYGYNASFDLDVVVAKLDSLSSVFERFNFPNLNDLGGEFSRLLEKNLRELLGMIKEPRDQLALLVVKIGILTDSLNSLIKKPGTISKLVESDELYEEIRETNQALKALIEDVKANPKKYLQIKVF